MDAQRFDTLVRSLGSGTRRRFTRSLLGLTLGGLVPLLGLAESEAGKKGKKGKGKKKKKKKKDPPLPAGTCRSSSDCNGSPDGPCCHGFLGVCRTCTYNPPCGCVGDQFCSEGSNESLCL